MRGVRLEAAVGTGAARIFDFGVARGVSLSGAGVETAAGGELVGRGAGDEEIF